MSQELTINTANLPANVLNPNAMMSNADLMSGISAGQPPRIGLKGTRFVLQTDAGETVINATEISVVVLRGRPGLSKTWYATKYDPNQTEFRLPDCFSNHGEKPEPGCALKQAEFCATCPQNVFGTGTAADGGASKGKACNDNKIMAVFYQGQIYALKTPPASLRSLGDYVSTLTRHQLDAHKVMTKVGFNPKFDYAVLTFEYAGVLPAGIISKMEEFLASNEVAAITHPTPYTMGTLQNTPASPAIAAPVQAAPVQAAPVQAAPAAVSEADAAAALGLGAETPAPAQATKAAAAKPKAAPKQAAPVQAAPAQNVVIPTTATEVMDEDDAAAAAELGLSL